jgi:hypothetical protein
MRRRTFIQQVSSIGLFPESKLTGRNTAVLLSRVSYSNNKNYNYADGFTLPMGR